MKEYLTPLRARRYLNKLSRPRVMEMGESELIAYQLDFLNYVKIVSSDLPMHRLVRVDEDIGNGNWHRFYQGQVRDRMRIIELLKRRTS